MANIKLKLLLFPLYKNKDKDLCPIYCKISYKGTRAEINTGEKIDRPDENWNKAKQIIKGKKMEILDANDRLGEFKNGVTEAYDKLIMSGKPFTASDIKRVNTTKEEVFSQESLGILAGFQVYIDFSKEREGMKGYSKNTNSKYISTKTFVEKFISSKYKQDDFPTSKINRTFVDELSMSQPTKRVLKNSYIKLQVTNLNSVLKFLFDQELIPIYKKITTTKKLISEASTYKHISDSSLKAIEALEFKTLSPTISKDYFIFQTLVGVAYVDLMNLKYSDIHSNYIKKKRQKTKREFKVYIKDEAWDIINKYKDHILRTGDFLFPKIPLRDYNTSLYRIGRLTNTKLSAHVGRHTFGTLRLDEGYTIESVSKMMGITITMAQKVYAEVTENRLEMEREIIEARKKNQAE